MENVGLFSELSFNEANDVYGGDWLETLGYNCRVTYNNVCKVASEFFSSGDVRMNETLMNCI